MKRSKKILNSLLISATLACAGVGGFLVETPTQNTKIVALAEGNNYDEISNSLPDYFKINETEITMGNVDNNIFLFSGRANEKISLQIANKTISGKGKVGETPNQDLTNYGYYSGEEITGTYSFFKFSNSLSLYYDLTNTQLENGGTSENLLQGQSISNFTLTHENGGIPNNIEFTPEQLNVNIKLGNEFSVAGNEITLDKEGCYTLRIPVVVYQTTNGGQTYPSQPVTINYTFMALNSTTYFNEASHLPNITSSRNMQENALVNASDYSKYYFHSYNTNETTNDFTLPTLEFNPNIYQFKVTYTDTDQNIKTTRIEYTDKFTQYDENNIEINEKDYFVWTSIQSTSKAKLIFNNLGTYDIEISYLYKSAENKIYNLPLNKLPSNTFQNKLQRVYIYGYQTFYADYNEIDPATNQPISKEFKTINTSSATFDNSADITMGVNKKIGETNSNPIKDSLSAKDLQENALLYINETDNIKTPASTNQTPVKFVSNAKVKTDQSGLWKLTKNANGEWKVDEIKAFSLLNQNSAGVYLYAIQYTFDNYLTTSGATGKDSIHYQIFFFEVTSLAPTVSLYEEETTTSLKELYTRGYTNKNVYIIDNSSKNPYDAKVKITLTAYDYKTGNNYFTREDIKSFENGRFGITYKTFTETETPNEIKDKSGVYISKSSQYANAKFTIEIKASNTTTPSITTFTIDTDAINDISARNVYETNSINFSIGGTLPQNFTNESIIFSWGEKASQAPTYGYLKYIPLQTKNYNYSSASLSVTLASLLEEGILPVDYQFDMNDLKNATWVEYSNTFNYTSTITASAVKQNSGFYLLEVFDEAGNVGFEIFLIDKTTPLFVKNLVELDESGQTAGEIRSFIANGENIDVPEEENSKAIIEWADKGIYLNNLDENSFDSITAYEFSKDSAGATTSLKEKLNEFFSTTQSHIIALNGAYIPEQGNYLKIGVNETYYALSGSQYDKKVGKSYDVSLFITNEKGEIEANEAQHSLLIRDTSNTRVYGDEATNYKNSPSGILNFRVTSDASKLDIKVGDKPTDNSNWEALQWANYNFSGYLDNNNLPMGWINAEEEQTITTNRYKYSYILPTNDKNKLSLTYIPRPSNGSVIENITLKYYPFEKQSFKEDSYKSGNDTSSTDGLVSNNYFYISVAKEPTKSYPIYQDGTVTVENGEERTFEIILGSTNFPSAGKYVFERIYQSQTSANVGKFDFFKRTITFIVDPYNVISPIESVQTTEGAGENAVTKTTLESIVGGDILISMYSGKNNQNIEISFPRYNNGLNQGSFYSQSSFEDSGTFQDDWISVSGNKLPLSLLIPEYKYTTSSIKTNTNDYIVSNNDTVTYYGIEIVEDGNLYKLYQDGVLVETYDKLEDAQRARNLLNANIDVYKLYAKIEFTPENSSQVTERYHGGNIGALIGKDNTTSNGYMKFFKQISSLSSQSSTLELEQTSTTSFTEPGKYVVTLYQANNRGSSFDQLYSLYKFGFKIEATSPKFEIVDSEGYTLEEQDDGNYYTNSSNLTIQWQIPKSEYLAKIDEDEIKISGSTTLTTFDNEGSTTAGGTRHFEFNASEIFNQMLSDGSLTPYIDITMQFEGHSNIYKTTTKRIYFDITAPSKNILSLIGKVENSARLNGISSYLSEDLLHSNAREYYDYNGNEITFNKYGNGNGVSYSYIKETGVFNRYYFNVDTSFIESLVIDENSYETKFVGIKQITNLAGYTPTDKNSFNRENYLSVDDIEQLDGIYEIVERDWAGNMTVYLISVSTLQDDDVLLEYSNKNIETKSFTFKEMKDSNNNIYSSTEFELLNINYNNDNWEIFSVTRADAKGTKVYMTSPWLENDNVYLVNGTTFETTTLSSIFDNANSSNLKHLIIFANRNQGDKTSLYVTIYNATLITSTSYLQPNAILSINVPSQDNLASTTYGYVYPVEIKVERLENKSYLPVVTATPTNGLYSNWTVSNPANSVSISISGGKLQLKTEISNAGEKLKYIIRDNFGNVMTLVQLANIPTYQEISGEGIVYEITESDTSKTYISKSPITFNYHTKLYSVIVEDEQGINAVQDTDYTKNTAQNISSLKFSKKNRCYTIKIYDVDDATGDPLRTIHIRLYNKLPEFTEDITAGGVTFLNKNLVAFEEEQTQIKSLPQSITVNGCEFINAQATYISTYSSVVTMRYTNSPFDNGENSYYAKNFTYSAYISSDNGLTFEKLEQQDGNISSHVMRGAGEYIIFFIYDDQTVLTSQYSAYMITIWDKNSSYYSITIDGTKVEKCDLVYADENRTIEVNYLVGIDYSNKNRVVITTNEELEVVITTPTLITTGTNVYVEIYNFSCAEASGEFAIIYIKPNNDFINQFNFELPSGVSGSLLGKSNSDIIVANASSDKLKITFTPFYGIKSNQVKLKVERMFEGNFVEVSPEIEYTNNIATAYITRAGYYRISLHDSCEPANYQSFNGANFMYLSFINYVPFVVTTEDNEGNAITTDLIQNAIYNSKVTLSLTDLSKFYALADRPQITVYRNGATYGKDAGNGHGYTEKNYTYTFTEPGYYQINFTAKSNNTSINSTFNFMIISKNESRSAFDFPVYSSYYIAKIEKLGFGDVTEDYLKYGNFKDKIVVNGKTYLSALNLSHIDEKTGKGRYTITICPNEIAYESLGVKEFSFDIWINYAVPPINVSIGQGEATTNAITVKFNVANFYEAVGDSYIKIGSKYYYYNAQTLPTLDEIETISITNAGTYYIQVYTASGQLIYSYKVIKNEPLNAFAIIAIVIGVIAFGTIIFITIKLRKRQKVK